MHDVCERVLRARFAGPHSGADLLATGRPVDPEYEREHGARPARLLHVPARSPRASLRTVPGPQGPIKMLGLWMTLDDFGRSCESTDEGITSTANSSGSFF